MILLFNSNILFLVFNLFLLLAGIIALSKAVASYLNEREDNIRE